MINGFWGLCLCKPAGGTVLGGTPKHLIAHPTLKYVRRMQLRAKSSIHRRVKTFFNANSVACFTEMDSLPPALILISTIAVV